MPEKRIFDDIARRLGGAIPASAQAVQDDLEKNLRAATQAAFTRLDLVTREEFDIQQGVLARTRTKPEELEKQVAELEAALLKQGKAE